MSRILFSGDPHLSCRAPASRIDDFAQSGIDKLNQIAKISKSHEVSYVVFLGDFFHVREQTWDYYNQVQAALAKIPATRLSIVGNSHDVPYDRFDLLSRTPIGGLMGSGRGVLQLLDRHMIPSSPEWELVGQSVNELPLREWKKPTIPNSIFVAHLFYTNAFDDPLHITPEEIDSLGYKFMFLGHDHTPYAPVITPGGTTVIRPGSLMRGTSHLYQLYRDVRVCILDTDTCEVENVNLEVTPREQAFSRKAIEKERKDEINMQKAIDFVSQVMKKMGPAKNNVYSVLDNMRLENSVRAYINEKLGAQGIFRDQK